MGLRVKETTRRLGGSSSRTVKERKAKRTFLVAYDATTPPASLAEVETASDGTTAIPTIATALAGDATRKVTSISVTPASDTGLVFNVEVEYATSEGGTVEENPLNVPIDYEWDFSASSQPYFFDESATPKAVATSAGEPFDNLLQREVGEIVVTITKNIAPAMWNPILAAQYMRPATAVNSDGITVDAIAVAAGQARFGGVRCSGIKTSNGIQYRTRTLVLKLSSSWDHKVDDRGLYELGDDDKPRSIKSGTPPTAIDKPWPLDGAGAAKASATDLPSELTFKPYPPQTFAAWLS